MHYLGIVNLNWSKTVCRGGGVRNLYVIHIRTEGIHVNFVDDPEGNMHRMLVYRETEKNCKLLEKKDQLVSSSAAQLEEVDNRLNRDYLFLY